MSKRSLIEELKRRREQLQKELEAVSVLIESYESDILDDTAAEVLAVGGAGSDDANIILPKGKTSWDEYSLYLLKKIGGVAKASRVADIAVKANPNIDKETVERAIKVQLSRHYRRG